MRTLGQDFEKKLIAEAEEKNAEQQRELFFKELHRQVEEAGKREMELKLAIEEDQARTEKIALQKQRDEERLAEARAAEDAERERNAQLTIELRAIAEREKLKEAMKKDAEEAAKVLEEQDVPPKPDDSGADVERCSEDLDARKKAEEEAEEEKKREAEEEARRIEAEQEKKRSDERRRLEIQEQEEAEEEERKKEERIRLYQDIYYGRE